MSNSSGTLAPEGRPDTATDVLATAREGQRSLRQIRVDKLRGSERGRSARIETQARCVGST